MHISIYKPFDFLLFITFSFQSCICSLISLLSWISWSLCFHLSNPIKPFNFLHGSFHADVLTITRNILFDFMLPLKHIYFKHTHVSSVFVLLFLRKDIFFYKDCEFIAFKKSSFGDIIYKTQLEFPLKFGICKQLDS